MAQQFDAAVKTVVATQKPMWAIAPDGPDIAVYVIAYTPVEEHPEEPPWCLWVNDDWYAPDTIPEEARALLFKRCDVGLDVLQNDDETVTRLWKGEKPKKVLGERWNRKEG